MRRRPFAAPPRREDGDAAVLPLVNVVFLLLTFLLIAGVIRPPEAFALRPPAAAEAEAPGPGALAVAMAADGRLALGARPLPRAALLAAAAAARPARLELRADAAVPARDALALAAALQAATGAPVDLVVRRP